MKFILALITVISLTLTSTSFAEKGQGKQGKKPNADKREKFKNMTDEQKQAFKEKRQANGEGKKDSKCKKKKQSSES